MSAREEVLARIRTALADRPAPAPVQRAYRAAGSSASADVDLFADRLRDYRATVHDVAPDEVAAKLAGILEAHLATRVAAAPGLPMEWVPAADRGPLDVTALDQIDAVVTGCTIAVAETATIILDHDAADQGPRALTLVPDLHLIVVGADQVVAAVPDAVAALAGVHTQTWISGPSATSDIELERVEGVHGPRRLEVLIVRN